MLGLIVIIKNKKLNLTYRSPIFIMLIFHFSVSVKLFSSNGLNEYYPVNQVSPYEILKKAERFCDQNQLDSAYKYVNLIIGEINGEIIKANYKLNSLRSTDMWLTIEQKLDSAYLSNYPNITNPALSIELWNIYIADQLYRSYSEYAEPIPPSGTKEYYTFQESQNKLRETRTKRVIQIIKNMGWPIYSQVGSISGDAVFYVLQHDRTKHMEKYIPLLKVAAMKGEASKENYAMMFDRIQLNNGNKQSYGTQLTFLGSKMVFFPVDDPENINKRRAEMDLEPIETYAERIRVEYDPNEDVPIEPTKF